MNYNELNSRIFTCCTGEKKAMLPHSYRCPVCGSKDFDKLYIKHEDGEIFGCDDCIDIITPTFYMED